MRKLSIGFSLVLLVVFVAGAVVSTGFQHLARYYPLAAMVAGALLTAIHLAFEVRRLRQGVPERVTSQGPPIAEGAVAGGEPTDGDLADVRAALPYLGWFLGYVAVIALVGIVYGTVVFLGTFLLLVARMRWWAVLVSVLVAVLLLNVISDVMNLYWPQSLTGL